MIAIIPARGGSKGIPLKNMVPVKGRPLIDWTIMAALNSKQVSQVIVSSDDQSILDHVKQFNGVIGIMRPAHLAEDTTPTEPVLMHVLEQIDPKDFELLLLLQPTSPLRDAEDIDKAFDLLNASDATALISVFEPKHHPLKSFKMNRQGYLEGLVNNELPFMPRQELPKIYQPNGAIYMVNMEAFIKFGKLITPFTIHYEMSYKKSIDIDAMSDVNTVNKSNKKE